MDALIEDFLALARKGRTIGEPEPVQLWTVAERAWSTVETADASLALPAEETVVHADEERLLTVCENLFANAVEHGGRDVTVTSETLDGVGFYVADVGMGIPPGREEQIFEHGVTESDEGTGFGLAIVRSIVDAHGWTIDVTAGETGGARFEIGTGPPSA